MIMELLLDLLKAFAVGGAICLIGQILIDTTKLTPGRILVLFVVAGVVLTALGLYEPLEKWAGAGATVPLTGFGYALAKGAMKGAESGLWDAITGVFDEVSGGIVVAIAAGYLIALFCSPKAPK